LKSRFGPEYDRVAEQTGSKWRADSELTSRQQRRQKLDIRPLEPQRRERYTQEWRQVQADFVDQPYEAVARADTLVTQVMRERGYPMENFDQHANDLSVDYPELTDNYRNAHAIATRQKSASTEELRQAMLHYRNLFDELLGGQTQGDRAQGDRATQTTDVSPNGDRDVQPVMSRSEDAAARERNR
ncbi:MAG TPA: hypothetical protein VIT43_02985, partial [Candidatus Dormibacteraeota bacterium]